MVICCPGAIRPAAMVPEKPRKSKSGRLTYCTAIRNAASVAAMRGAASSKAASRLPPVYHGIRSVGASTLSPATAQTGIAVTSSPPSWAAKA